MLGDEILFHHYKVGVRMKKSEAEGRTDSARALAVFLFLVVEEEVSLRCEDGQR